MNYLFKIPQNRKIRVIVDTDAKNEADDQFALAHFLMTSQFDVKGVVAAHFDQAPRNYGRGNTAHASFEEAKKVMSLMDLEGACPLVEGAPTPMRSETEPVFSQGAQLIIDEAMKTDERPLYVASLGAITDVAAAVLAEPRVASRMTCVWVGGDEYPGGDIEFNLWQDINALNAVMASNLPLWQIPRSIYSTVGVSLAELQYKVRPCGEIGKYLFEQMVDFNEELAQINDTFPMGEIWSLGDSPSVTALQHNGVWSLQPAFRSDENYHYTRLEGARPIRVYSQIDTQLTLNDFFSKLALNYGV
jgi:inosine-uridine nucleoside N-ribohydrolase